MARYLAREFKLAGKTPTEEAQCDMIVDFMEDFIKPLIPIFTEQNEEKKEELKKKYVDETAVDLMGKLEKLLVSNNGGDGFLVGDSVTWADFTYVNCISFPSAMNMELKWETCPKLKAL